MYYGFIGFCEDFLTRHPQYIICPIRLNGSAVESQLKYISGGNLMSTNYSSASAIKNDISKRCRDDDYRNAPLFLRQHSHHTDIQKLNKSLLL